MKLTKAQIEKFEEALTRLHQKTNEAGYDDSESDVFDAVMEKVEDYIKEFE